MIPIFDGHFHLIDPAYPLYENQGHTPASYRLDDYIRQSHQLGFHGGALVASSFQGFDQTFMLDALRKLGSNYVGVIQLGPDISADTLSQLNQAGVKGIRFNIKRGMVDPKQIREQAILAWLAFGWHVELYVENRELKEVMSLLGDLPQVAIDHIGLTDEGFDELRRLVGKGIKVKLSGFSRGDLDVANAIEVLHQENPEALIFGSDLPSTRTHPVFTEKDIALIKDVLPESAWQGVFRDNAMAFYHRPRK